MRPHRAPMGAESLAFVRPGPSIMSSSCAHPNSPRALDLPARCLRVLTRAEVRVKECEVTGLGTVTAPTSGMRRLSSLGLVALLGTGACYSSYVDPPPAPQWN